MKSSIKIPSSGSKACQDWAGAREIKVESPTFGDDLKRNEGASLKSI